MLARNPTPATGRARARSAMAGLFAVSALALTACGGSSFDPAVEAAAPTAAPATPAPTTAATTTTAALAPSSTSSTSTSTSTSSTTSTTTATATSTPTSTSPSTTTLVGQVPQPIAPPADIKASEPVIEVGRIIIPKIGVDMAMYEGIRLTTLDYGPGHWPGAAMPGQVGNVVVAGHRTSKHRVFRNVDDLVAGDEIIFEDESGTHVYHVRATEIVGPEALWIVDPTETPTVTLFACHPPGSTAKRIVVYGDLVS